MMFLRIITILLLVASAAGFSYSADYIVGPGDVLEITVYDLSLIHISEPTRR